MSLSAEERYYIKLKASYLHYIEGKTQSELAKLFNVSRPTLIKLLNDAREEGIVKIEINDVQGGACFIEKEQELCKRLDLKDVKIIRAVNNDQESINTSIGMAAAQYFARLLIPGMTVGIAWGNTLQLMVNYQQPDNKVERLQFVPLLGGLSSPSSEGYSMFANSLCEQIASKYSKSVVNMLYAPLYVQDREMAETYRNSAEISKIFDKMAHLDVAVVGIDSDLPHSTTIQFEKNLQQDFNKLQKEGMVGNICANFYDINGKSSKSGIEHNIIAITPENLQKTPLVIGAAGGEYKVASIIGGARAKFYNVLITDEITAGRILDK